MSVTISAYFLLTEFANMKSNLSNHQATNFDMPSPPPGSVESKNEHQLYAERLEILNEVGRELTWATTELELLNKIASAAKDVLGTEQVSYSIPDDSDCEVVSFFLTGNDKDLQASKTSIKNTVAEAVSKTLKPTLFENLGDSELPEHTKLARDGYRMSVSCPVVVGGVLVGVLSASTKTGWNRPHDSLTLFTTLGHFIGTTLERINAEERVKLTFRELKHQARYDELTGLANRSYFLDLLEEEIALASSKATSFSLLFVDLDQFKVVNDSLSHSAGDELLRLVAQRMQKQLRPSDTVARLGGDEFVVLLRSIDDFESAWSSGNRLIERLREPYTVVGQRVEIAGSIGLSVFPDHGETSDELMMHADLAMYAAKANGRNNCQMYQPAMSDKLRYRLELVRDLMLAKENDDLYMMFQPQFENDCQTVIGVEALIRWDHLIRGSVPPSEFMAVAEQNNVVCELTGLILNKSLKALADLRQHYPNLYVSVNLSARDFIDSAMLHCQIAEALATYDLPGNALELELTERVFLEHASIASRSMELWKESGIRLAIDDFGTGFSSLNYLLNLDIDTIKIDRCFIDSIQAKPRQQGVVKTILELGATLGARCVAEGLERQEELDCLVELGCERFQGFLFGRPMSLETLFAFLDDMRDLKAKQHH